MIQIRLATKKDIDDINVLYKEVIKDLEKKKIDMLWGNVYPFCEVENDIMNKEMYIVESKDGIVGSFVLSDFDDPEYHDIKWSREKRFIYLNRLVVNPLFQKKGIAKTVLKLIEKKVKKEGYESIRLTVYEENFPAINLYEKIGFKKIEVGCWKLEDKKFIGYEKNKID